MPNALVPGEKFTFSFQSSTPLPTIIASMSPVHRQYSRIRTVSMNFKPPSSLRDEEGCEISLINMGSVIAVVGFGIVDVVVFSSSFR